MKAEITKRFHEFLDKKEPPYEKNILKDHKRVDAILKGQNPPPYEVEIQPSSSCNLKCEHCFGQDYIRLPNLMGKKEIREIAKKINDFQEDGLKVEVAKFCGTTGDPFVNSEVTVEGIRLFSEMGKDIVVYTNGLYLDRSEGGNYYNEISQIKRLNLSLDAGSEEVFTVLKGRSGFNRIINSLEEISKRKGNNSQIVVSYVIGRKNYNDVVNAAKIIKNTGADELSFRVDFTDLETIKGLSDVIIDNINKAKQYSANGFKVISAYSENNIKEGDVISNKCSDKCFTTGLWASIGPNCELYACGHRTHGGVKSYGNLLTNNFRYLWNSKERLDAIAELPNEYCKVCSPFPGRINPFMEFLSNLPGGIEN